MCGIFGVLISSDHQYLPGHLRETMDRLFILSESRGKEASGLALRTNDQVIVHKSPLPASAMVRTRTYREILAAYSNGGGKGENGHSLGGPLAVIGHSRLVTNGLETNNENNQPVTYEGITGIHNGIVVNVDALWEQFPELHRRSEVDSEVILALLSHHGKALESPRDALAKTFGEIEGAASVAVLFKESDKAFLATNTGSLYFCINKSQSATLFASEKYIMRRLLEQRRLQNEYDSSTIAHLSPGEGLEVDLGPEAVKPFTFGLHRWPDGKNRTERSIPEVGTLKIEIPPEPDPKELRRCTTCVLPETMPFIEFDWAGVCNFCHNYRPMAVLGVDRLEEALSPYRKGNGEPDCVMAFSGGRDSSQGLHLLKSKYGMTPLALTYDWGMVTDLARRNQARVTGALGVEHILVSANIRRNRQNIGRNVKAWLKKPELGMIPLFMAGDKPFFFHSNRLAKHAELKLIVFCVNPMEKTDFKTGFCSINPGKDVYYYNTSMADKLRIAGFYGKNFLTNPGYLNRSLLDTAWAYISTYFISHEYLQLFDYIRWDEDEINQTLITEYDWETAKDTNSTWRIGDGTASFYNYIYHRVAGFTENDTFRSNQVREGVITRDQALNLVSDENKPRYDSIREYLDLIGLDFDDTLAKIEAIPRLYRNPLR